jgi:hypothetical protein
MNLLNIIYFRPYQNNKIVILHFFIAENSPQNIDSATTTTVNKRFLIHFSHIFQFFLLTQLADIFFCKTAKKAIETASQLFSFLLNEKNNKDFLFQVQQILFQSDF